MKTNHASSIGATLTLLVAALMPHEASALTDTITTRTHRLKQVEVQAAAAPKTVTSTSPVYRLDNDQMKMQGVTDISDAIHRLPGVNLRDYGGAGGMKTVSVRGFGATHTGVVYDGIVLSDCQSGKIDLSRYSLDNVGSLSMVVGDNDDIFIPAKVAASAATINISTMSVPEADDSLWHFTGQLKIGSWGYTNPFFRIGKTIDPKFSFSVIGEYLYADNDYPFTLVNGKLVTRERRSNSRMNSGHGEAGFTWRMSPRNVMTGKVYYYDNDRLLPGPVILYNPVCHEKLRDRNFFGQVGYSSVVTDKVSLKLNGKFNWDASLYHDEDGKYPGGVLDEDYWQREVYFSTAVLYMPAPRWALDYSADYAYNNLSSNQPGEQRPWRHTVLQSATARYKSGRFTAMARLLWSLYYNGVHSGESARDANKLSPSVSVSVQPFASAVMFLRASYKNIFRMPTFNDSYFYHMGSTSLRPETTDQFNLGVTWQIEPRSWLSAATFTVDGYFNHVKDKIVAVPYNMFIWNMTNLDKVRAFGVDVTANMTLSVVSRQNIVIAGNYSFQRVQPRTHPDNADYNKQVAYTPRHSGAVSISYENPWVNLTFHSTGVSCRYGTNSNLPLSRIGGYMECGVTAFRKLSFGRNHVELRADLINMFDKQYEIVSRYPMPDRSWRVAATYSF